MNLIYCFTFLPFIYYLFTYIIFTYRKRSRCNTWEAVPQDMNVILSFVYIYLYMNLVTTPTAIYRHRKSILFCNFRRCEPSAMNCFPVKTTTRQKLLTLNGEAFF